MVAAILDGGDATWINFYGSDGTLIAENQTHLADPGYPLDVAVSGSGDIMMVFITLETSDRAKMIVLSVATRMMAW